MLFGEIAKKVFRERFPEIKIDVFSLDEINMALHDNGRRKVEMNFSDEDCLLGMEIEPTHLGFCYNPQRKILEYVNLFVLPCKRGRGLGSFLVETMEDVGKEVGCKRVDLCPRNTSQAINFWHNLGDKENLPDEWFKVL